MRTFLLSLLSVFVTNTALAVLPSVTCTAAPSNETKTVQLILRSGTSSYEGEVKFKDSSAVFSVLNRPGGLTIATVLGDTVIMADSQNSTTGTTIALSSLSNRNDFIKVSCKPNKTH